MQMMVYVLTAYNCPKVFRISINQSLFKFLLSFQPFKQKEKFN